MMMQKNILVFSNGEKIGDGIIKLPLLNEIKRRLPDRKLYWMTNSGLTVYNSQLKNLASQYIDHIYEKAELNSFFWQKISNNFELDKIKFEYIFDTQKAVLRTIALKRIHSSYFISASASGFFSDKNIKKNADSVRRYYLEELFDLLNLIKKDEVDRNFKISIPNLLETNIEKILKKDKLYFGISPGAGEKNKIWPIEKFEEVANFFQKNSYRIVFFLGPQEKNLKQRLVNNFPDSIFLEELIDNFSGPEIIMASTKFLSCALTNDSGTSHMLSTNYCPVFKLFGPKNPDKFTPKKNNLYTISSKEFDSNNIEDIEKDYVINKLKNFLKI